MQNRRCAPVHSCMCGALHFIGMGWCELAHHVENIHSTGVIFDSVWHIWTGGNFDGSTSLIYGWIPVRICFRHFLDDSLEGVENIEEALDVPVLISIPYDKKERI